MLSFLLQNILKPVVTDNRSMFFLLLVQKKERKKSTPATIPIAIGTAVAGALIKLQCYAEGIPLGVLIVLNNSYHRHRPQGAFFLVIDNFLDLFSFYAITSAFPAD